VVALLSLSGAAASQYDTPGPYAVAQTTVLVAAAAPGTAGTPFGLGGEEGVLAVHYPAFVAPGTRLPFAYYQHPTHGWSFQAGAYTRPLLTSSCAISDTKAHPKNPMIPPNTS
jgi:hypothetical protein